MGRVMVRETGLEPALCGVLLYRITCPWKGFTPLMAKFVGDANGNVNLSAIGTVKNKPF